MISQMPKILSYREGCSIDDTLFWFDGPSYSHDISFLSTFPTKKLPVWGVKFIMSEELSRLVTLSSKKMARITPMVCQYLHPFSIGSYQIEFLPAGNILGASSIYIDSGQWSLLYASAPMPASDTFTAETVLRKSDILVLTTPSPDLTFNYPSKQQTLGSIREYIEDFHHQHEFYPIIVTESLGCAQEMISDFDAHNIRVSVTRQMYNFSKLYQEYGIPLGNSWTRYYRKYFRDKVLIMSRENLARLKLTQSFRRSTVYVTGRLASYFYYQDHGKFDKYFFLNQESTLADLRATIREVEPKQVVLVGSQIKQYREHLQPVVEDMEIEMVASYPNRQPTLYDLSHHQP
ncbi:MAG: hypothetical protein OXC40_05265 [Proteobacteria bacterium]|nr:hypothetical protein [Pseudomonadota bacterium]